MAMAVDAKLLRTTKFPPQFNQKVDMQKVNVDVMKKYAPALMWVRLRILTGGQMDRSDTLRNSG